ncbi:MAG TPA: aminotransferase class I/II-fold pyridoxal phosphate-dependent enzyme, partial [Thermomicrobiales bacterium]|nr:aminotransferase class I/II-fold pyridoxal phosphate-dependent enzyme [Thermomicrobiales bacterium]
MTASLPTTTATTFRPFALEEWQSRYEQEVRWNIADSGVQPVILSELLGDDPDALARLLAMDLHYPPVNGTPLLRERIAALYPDVSPDQVLVTVGAAEANGIATTTLTQPGDHVIVLEPGYRQVAGVAANHGCEVEAFHLVEARGWRPDLDELAAKLRPDTRLIAVSNPNNPTGAILTPEEVAEIVRLAASVGAWVLADEVYRGTEVVAAAETPSFAGQYDRLVLTNSLSKAYGLSGLRVGWTISDEETMQAMWRRHEYATIATSNVSMALAELAVEPAIRARLFARNRTLIRDGLARLNEWVDSTDGLVSLTPPYATALAFIRY